MLRGHWKQMYLKIRKRFNAINKQTKETIDSEFTTGDGIQGTREWYNYKILWQNFKQSE